VPLSAPSPSRAIISTAVIVAGWRHALSSALLPIKRERANDANKTPTFSPLLSSSSRAAVSNANVVIVVHRHQHRHRRRRRAPSSAPPPALLLPPIEQESKREPTM
jgi:hypothetical protein